MCVQGTCITWGRDAPRATASGTFGLSGRLISIVKCRSLGLGKRVSCAKLSMTFLHKELPFGGL